MMLLAFVLALALAVLGAWFFVIRGSGGQGVVPVGDVAGPDGTTQMAERPGGLAPRVDQGRSAPPVRETRAEVPGSSRGLPRPGERVDDPDRPGIDYDRANMAREERRVDNQGDSTTIRTAKERPVEYEGTGRAWEGGRRPPRGGSNLDNRGATRSRNQPAGAGNLERRTSSTGVPIPAARREFVDRTRPGSSSDSTTDRTVTGSRYDSSRGAGNAGAGSGGTDYDRSGTYYNDGTGQTQPRPEQDYTDPANDLIPYEDRDPTLDEEVKEVPPEEEQVEEKPDPSEKLTGIAFLQVPPEIPVGTTVEVPVIIETGDRYLAAYGLDLAWDTSVLSVDQVTAGAHFDPPAAINLEPDVGRLRFNAFTITPSAAGTISVANLTVTVRAQPPGGSTTIRPSSSGQTIAVYGDDGTTPLEVKGAAFATATVTVK